MSLLDTFTPEEQERYKRQLEDWKNQYFGQVYMSEIEDEVYIWRGMSKGEYKKAVDYYEDEYERAEFVCRQCVLFPEIKDWSLEIYAGIPEVLTEAILMESGFTLTAKELDGKILEEEQKMLTFDNQMACIIKEAFPDISLEEIDRWQFQQVIWYYARAKWTLETLRGIRLERDDDSMSGMPPM